MSNSSKDLKKLITPGTPQCSVLFALIGVIIAALLLTIGFWKTLFILAFGAVGAVLGGIGNKGNAVRDMVNRRIPNRDVPLPEIARDRGDVAEIVEKVEKAVAEDGEENDTQEAE